MNCNCVVRCFVCQTLEPDGDFYKRVLISTCGVYIIDGKKKSKCDFYNKKILKTGIVIDSPIIVKKEHEKYILDEYVHGDEKSRKDIESNINLLRIAQIYPVNISNYISLINYNLRKLQYKPFFLNKESIEQLIKRLEYKPDDVRKPVVFPTKYKPKYKPKKITNKKQNIKYDIDLINLESIIESEDSSDFSDENENYILDIDYDTVDEDDNIEEAFSD